MIDQFKNMVILAWCAQICDAIKQTLPDVHICDMIKQIESNVSNVKLASLCDTHKQNVKMRKLKPHGSLVTCVADSYRQSWQRVDSRGKH